MCSAISSRPRLDDLKKEARQLLHSLHRRDAAAVKTLSFHRQIGWLGSTETGRRSIRCRPRARLRQLARVYLEKTFTVVGELWMVVLW
jgi:hypothetical protein